MSNKAINKLKKIMYDNLSYTSQDYDTIMAEMIDLIQGGDLPTTWNNLTETDPILLLFSLFAAHKDILNYMLDYRVLESYMTTAREKRSIVRIAKSYGYKIPSYSAARVQYKVSSEAFEEIDEFTLKSFTSLLDANGVAWTYTGKERIIKKEDESTHYIDLYQGSPMSITFDGVDIDGISKTKVIAATSIALSNSYDDTEVFKLRYADEIDFIYTTLTQTTEQGTNLYDVDVDTNEMTYLQFLPYIDNISTSIGYGGEFEFTYINTMGATHISPAETVIITLHSATDKEDITLELEKDSYYPGKNPESVTEIKESFKNFYAGIKSLVTVKDYANYIKNIQKAVPSISKVYVLDKQTDSNGGSGEVAIPDFTVAIYTTKKVSEEHVELSPEDIEALEADLNKHKITGVSILINDDLDTETVDLDIIAEIGDSDMEEVILAEIEQFLLDVNIGNTVTIKDIINMLESKDLTKCFNFGSNMRFNHVDPFKNPLKFSLSYNKYIDTVNINLTDSE